MPRSKNPLRVSPSVLASNFARLGEEVKAVAQAGADWIHVDVMDGCFAPNITVGPAVVAAIRAVTDKLLDVHLMIVQPERHLQAFAEAGADLITVHVEACTHLHRTLQEVHGLGKRVGVSLNPHTHESSIGHVLDQLDLILVMSVNPGFSGQEFLPSVLPKISAARRMIDAAGRAIDLQVDGGVNRDNVKQIVEVGADVVVAGNAVFKAKDYAEAIRALKSASA